MISEMKTHIKVFGGLALLVASPLVIGQPLDGASAQSNAGFGCSVVGLGDTDGDLVPDIAVGLNSSEKTAYVYSGANGSFLTTLNDESLLSDSDSGCSLAQMGNANGETVVGDVTGDTVPEIAIADESGQDRVFVFSGADGELVHTLIDPNPKVAANSQIALTFCVVRYKYVTSGGWRTLESFWNATGSGFFKAPANAQIKVRYGVGWFGKDRQKQTLNGYSYKKLDIGAWSVTYARMQMKVPSSTYVTYLACPGGLGTSFPPIPF